MSRSDIETKFENVDIEMIDEPDTGGEAVTAESVEREWHADQLRRAEAAHRIANAPRRERYERERRDAEQKAAGRVTASGGETVRTELRGGVGQAVADVLRLDRIAESARKIEHRIAEEQREMEARTVEDRDAELLAAAWEDASAKRKVSPVLAPAWEHATREVPGVTEEHGIGSRWVAERLLVKVHAKHAQKAYERVREALADVDAVIVEHAERILAGASEAADALQSAGVSLDASAEEIVEHGDGQALAAFKGWRDAVTRWGDLQSVRRWVAVAVEVGFEPEDPERLACGDHQDVEARVWRSQFEGSRVGVPGAGGALAWWVINGRPAPIGVGSSEKAGAEQ